MIYNNLISIKQFCSHYSIPITFINALKEYDLIEIIIDQNNDYIDMNHINDLEKMIRLHYDLDINLEGIDAIYNLLNQVESLKEEIATLQNKLRLYDDF